MKTIVSLALLGLVSSLVGMDASKIPTLIPVIKRDLAQNPHSSLAQFVQQQYDLIIITFNDAMLKECKKMEEENKKLGAPKV